MSSRFWRDGPPPDFTLPPDAHEFLSGAVRGSYEDGFPLNLGVFGTLDPMGEVFDVEYWTYEGTVYRERDGIDAWLERDGEYDWRPVVPSFNDYAHMREITYAEAQRLIAAAAA